MLSTTIVIFREVLEIALILGIVLAATRGLKGRMGWILGGLAAGFAGASLIAVFAESISGAMEGMGQEFFNAMILLAAAGVIGWTVVWMSRHAREMGERLKRVGHDVSQGRAPFYSLAVIIGLAMLREGSEIVLFTYGMLLSGQSVASIAAGAALGVALGTAAGALLYLGLIKMSVKYMLRVTSALLILLVAGLTSQAAGFLTAAGYFSDWSDTVWDTSWLLSESSVTGMILHSLIGYSSQPSEIQLLCYASVAILLLSLTRFTSGAPSRQAVAA